MPSIDVIDSNGRCLKGLIDTGCSRSVVSRHVPVGDGVRTDTRDIVMMDGSIVRCHSCVKMHVYVCGNKVDLDCIIAEVLPGYEILLGVDAISQLGGVYVSGSGEPVEFGRRGNQHVGCTSIALNDCDYDIKFQNGKWVAKWTWDCGEPPCLTNRVPNYRIDDNVVSQYEKVVNSWIEKGWLQRYDGEYDGLLPLMVIVQQSKNKVRPVLDYRELNQYISSHTGESEVCAEHIRRWRKMGDRVCILDLRDAYLQVHVDSSLWKYQVVEFKGIRYCLTRLGFGLNVAPKIMSAIVHRVLSDDPSIRAGTDSYVDDVIVDESQVSVNEVREKFRQFGLECKDPEPLDGTKVLGLQVRKDQDVFVWQRGNTLPSVPQNVSKRQLFSICGQLVGHYPVGGWLRPACSYLKRLANSVEWDEKVSDCIVLKLKDIFSRVEVNDPVKGVWTVSKGNVGTVWCDASSIATGIVVEINDVIVEDNCWLRKTNDGAHINLAELDAVVKGINAAVSWDLTTISICTDSATVYGWMSSILNAERRIKARGLGEVLVKRRLSLIKNIIDECGLIVSVTLVGSALNKADSLTRVPQKWLRSDSVGCALIDSEEIISSVHAVHHFGVDRTHYFVKLKYPRLNVLRQDVENVVKKCKRCSRVDPAPLRWEKGELSVEKNWDRLAGDVTHYLGHPYLTLVDCGPSRFAIWRKLSDESAHVVSEVVQSVFREHGPPREVLLDNALTFKSQLFIQTCQKWDVSVNFRCAYRASGNGIVERVHRTIKRMSARSGGDILDMVFWYNASPKRSSDTSTVPANQVFSYPWHIPHVPRKNLPPSIGKSEPTFKIGQKVYVKPGGARCTTVWPEGRITGEGRGTQLEVDGIPRHIADIRVVPEEDNVPRQFANARAESGEQHGDVSMIEIEPMHVLRQDGSDDSESDNGSDEDDAHVEGRPQRVVRPIARYGDPLINWTEYLR